MSKLRSHISMSLDAFVAGPNPSEASPLGEGGERLHGWAFSLAAWRLAELISTADLGKIHLVAPDVGTAAALFAAAAHPERIASAVVGTGGVAVPIDLGEPLRSWVLDPDLDRYRRIDPRAIVNTAVDTIAGRVPDEIRVDYLDCYDGDRFVESMAYVRRYPAELPELAELLPQIPTPITIINGLHDRAVPLSNAEFLKA
ncbi:MAG TPA: alpha/beta hydrolase, partial [Solirubrobacteraceae bacterium]